MHPWTLPSHYHLCHPFKKLCCNHNGASTAVDHVAQAERASIHGGCFCIHVSCTRSAAAVFCFHWIALIHGFEMTFGNDWTRGIVPHHKSHIRDQITSEPLDHSPKKKRVESSLQWIRGAPACYAPRATCICRRWLRLA